MSRSLGPPSGSFAALSTAFQAGPDVGSSPISAAFIHTPGWGGRVGTIGASCCKHGKQAAAARSLESNPLRHRIVGPPDLRFDSSQPYLHRPPPPTGGRSRSMLPSDCKFVK